MSLAEMVLLVSVNVTLLVAGKEAAFIVIWPADVFNVTPVDFDVAW
jgi:hypothetical protein